MPTPPAPTPSDDPRSGGISPGALLGGLPGDMRTRWIGLSAIAGAALFAFLVTAGIFLPAIDQLGAGAGVQQAADLPAQLLVCDREYVRADAPVEVTAAEIKATDGRDPAVVSGSLPGCPSGVCLEGGLCLPVVYVRTEPDRYVAFELAGS